MNPPRSAVWAGVFRTMTPHDTGLAGGRIIAKLHVAPMSVL
jgi:hypothetical protein